MTDDSVSGVRVLVVDAEPMILDLLTLALPPHGLQVVGAANAGEAVKALGAEPGGFAVALLSVRGSDGPRTLAALRAIDPDLKAVFMTGDVDPNLALQLLALGASAVVPKPLGLADLAALLLRLTK